MYWPNQDFLLLAMQSYCNLKEWAMFWCSDACIISKIVSYILVTALLLWEILEVRLGLQGSQTLILPFACMLSRRDMKIHINQQTLNRTPLMLLLWCRLVVITNLWSGEEKSHYYFVLFPEMSAISFPPWILSCICNPLLESFLITGLRIDILTYNCQICVL